MSDVDADEEALLIQWIFLDLVVSYWLFQSQLIGSSLVNTSGREVVEDIERSGLRLRDRK